MKTDLKLYGPMEVGCTAGNDLFGSVADVENNYRGPVNSEDHEVSLVGYVDDTKVQSGGYWIIKNSWGYNDNVYSDYVNNGYYLIPYGNLENHNDISAITGAAYYTGAMATVTWGGGTGTWTSGGGNWSGVDQNGNTLSSYNWENKETARHLQLRRRQHEPQRNRHRPRHHRQQRRDRLRLQRRQRWR